MSAPRVFFSFYGGKFRIAPRYPRPKHNTIVEPFAGSAGYSLRHFDRRVILVERDPAIAGTWRFLLRSSAADILALPDIKPGQSVDDLHVCQEARWLIGWWLNPASSQPKKVLSAWGRSGPRADTDRYAVFWGRKIRERIAATVEQIRHWRLIEGEWDEAPNIEATWFVDPPYQGAGRHYRHHRVDYAALGDYCRGRRGQTIVCENVGADWLPFDPFVEAKAAFRKRGTGKSSEAIWLSR